MARCNISYQKQCERIAREDIAASRSASFTAGRIAAMDEENPDPEWTYEKWARLAAATNANLKDLLEGVTFQRSINAAIRLALTQTI